MYAAGSTADVKNGLPGPASHLGCAHRPYLGGFASPLLN